MIVIEPRFTSFIEQFFYDWRTVADFFIGKSMNLFNTLYRNNEWNFLFYSAVLPAFLMLAFDIVFSFILSFRLRQVKIFNVLSPRSWSALRNSASDPKNYPRDNVIRYSRFSVQGLSVLRRLGIIKPKNKKVVKYNSKGELVVSSVPDSHHSSENLQLHLERKYGHLTQKDFEAADQANRISNYMKNQSELKKERSENSKKHPSINIEADDID